MSNILFARYYNQERKLIEVSMSQINLMIRNEIEKEALADHIYHRMYDRFLKIFDFSSLKVKLYHKDHKESFLNAVFNP